MPDPRQRKQLDNFWRKPYWIPGGGIMPTIRRFAVAMLAGVCLGYIVYPPPQAQDAEEPTISPKQLLCDAISAQPKQNEPPRLQSADEVLAFVSANYANCTTCDDGGTVESTWTYPGGEQVSRSANFSMVFQRPDRLRFQFTAPNGTSIFCNERDDAYSC